MSQPQEPTTLDLQELAKILEPIIRQVIREELTRVLRREPDIFRLTPEMPLYEDMEDIKRRKDHDQIELYSHEEVWSE